MRYFLFLLIAFTLLSCSKEKARLEDNIVYTDIDNTTLTSVPGWYSSDALSYVPVTDTGECALPLDIDRNGKNDLQLIIGHSKYEQNNGPHPTFNYEIKIKGIEGRAKIAVSHHKCILYTGSERPFAGISWDETGYLYHSGLSNIEMNTSFTGPKYVAVRLYENGDIYQGWLLVEKGSYFNITVKSFAANLTPAQPVAMGQTE